MPDRAVVYSRVSDDKANGRSVAQQQAESRKVCERNRWEIVADLKDNDVGASRHSMGRRPGWEEVLGLIRSGRVDWLVTWELSRAERKNREIHELMDVMEEHRVRWWFGGKGYDLSDDDDRFLIGFNGLVAAKESDNISSRVKRAAYGSAMDGRVPGGRAPYGYRRRHDPATGDARLEIDDQEADVVRRVFSEYLEGRGTNRIAKGLNADGIVTATGGPWQSQGVRRVVVNPAYAGRRKHCGEAVADGSWEPIIDPSSFDRAQALLASKKESGARSRAGAHLLTGVGRCGVCGSRLHMTTYRGAYQCAENFCTQRNAERLDAYVTAVVLERLSRPDVDLSGGEVPPEVEAASQERQKLEERRDAAVQRYSAGDLNINVLVGIQRELDPKIEAAKRAERAALTPLEIDVDKLDIDGWWDRLDRSQRREIVGAVLSTVIVDRTTHGTRSLDPDAVRIEWR